MHCIEPGHSLIEAMGEQSGTSAQRIRIGLTGLAFAFLLVLLGSIVSRSGDNGDPAPASQSENAAQPEEPLAELGVAPGAADVANNSSSNQQ